MEDVDKDLLLLALHRAGVLAPCPERRESLCRQIHEAAVAVLRRADAESDRSLVEVDLAPLELEQLAASKANPVGEDHQRANEVVWQLREQPLEFLALEENLAGVVEPDGGEGR